MKHLIRSAEHHFVVPGTEGSEIIAENAEISLRNRCFFVAIFQRFRVISQRV